MKKHLVFCITFVALMTSCVKEPSILRRLTDEEAAILPYRMGESIRMLNQDGDTLRFTVVSDTTYVSYDYINNYYSPNARMKYEPIPYFYMCEVVLQSQPEGNYLLRCHVAPEKVVTVTYENLRFVQDDHEGFYYWHSILGRTLSLNNLSTTTFTIGETTYENVYVDRGTYMSNSTDITYAWYYSEQLGLLAAKQGEYALTLIP